MLSMISTLISIFTLILILILILMSIFILVFHLLITFSFPRYLQGMSLSSMTEGVNRIVQLALEIDTDIGHQRIKFIDIGRK